MARSKVMLIRHAIAVTAGDMKLHKHRQHVQLCTPTNASQEIRRREACYGQYKQPTYPHQKPCRNKHGNMVGLTRGMEYTSAGSDNRSQTHSKLKTIASTESTMNTAGYGRRCDIDISMVPVWWPGAVGAHL